ncbi:unnamed protein product [Sphagnum jensenii]
MSYNGKDTYYTALVALALIKELPEYAWTNYLQEFPIVFPCILCEHTGIKWDEERGKLLKEEVDKQLASELRSLQTMVGNSKFNPGSPKQTTELFAILGSKDITSSGKVQLDKVSSRHPLNKFILDKIVRYRSNVKLSTSYFKDGVAWLERVFYALNPHGTDTGRLASRESQFWCGLQIQNIPREDDEKPVTIKQAFVSDPGFFFGEADFSQAETRGTAYLSGDTVLIAVVEDESKDFHSWNASQFFGIAYEKLCLSLKKGTKYVHKRLNKKIINVAKRTNHGANYNMGAGVMVDTMGISKVIEARILLGLPKYYTVIKVCEYLLQRFDKTYVVVRGAWYEKVIEMVESTQRLVGPTGWTRLCFGNPRKNKRDLNALVAHPPQSLNAMLLNKAFLEVFLHVWLPNTNDFKLHAQIHDSILFSYRKGRKDLALKVKEYMLNPIDITDTFGVKRTMIVPVDLKGEATRWSDVKDLEDDL